MLEVSMLILVWLLVPVLSAVSVDPCKQCCSTIGFKFPDQVFYPSDISFATSMSYYWAAQETENRPTCIVSPRSADDVRNIMQIISSATSANRRLCYFAIRSGGLGQSHDSNQPGGVNIDLRDWNSVSVTHNKTIARIGPGTTWTEVYAALDLMNLTVAGARAGDVGAGGYILGGGVSYLSPQVGFGSDTVVNFEIVLSTGDVVNANATSNPDLFVALRGGQNNCGIVTRVDMSVFALPEGKMWGGTVYQNISTVSQQLEVLSKFTNDANYDPKTSVIQTFGTNGQMTLVLNDLVYMESTVKLPAKLEQFQDIETPVQSTVRKARLTEFVMEKSAASPKGFRQTTFTTTLRPTPEILHMAFTIWNTTIPSLQAVRNLSYGLSFEPVPEVFLLASASRGGNMLNLPPPSGPLLIVLLSTSWRDSADDQIVQQTSAACMSKIEKKAKESGVWHEYKYIGYANAAQKVLPGYGQRNVDFMKKVSRKYDPRQVFQFNVPGGFKLADLNQTANDGRKEVG